MDGQRVAESQALEVTPEMIEAGRAALAGFDLADIAEGYESKFELLEAIFRAMAAKSRQLLSGRPSLEKYPE